jgi:hypothetical protein
VENCTSGQAADGNIIQRMRIDCWITTARVIRSEYVDSSSFYWTPRKHFLAAVGREENQVDMIMSN